MEQPHGASVLQKKFFFSLLVVGIVPGIAALIATYLYSTAALKEAIGEGFQEIARSTAIRLASAVDDEIDRAVRLALVPVHIKQRVAASNSRYRERNESSIRRLLSEGEANWTLRANQGDESSLVLTTRYLEEWAQQAGYTVRVMVADQQGALVVSTDRRTQYLQTDQTWWKEAMNSAPNSAYVSSLVLDPHNR